MSSDDRFGSIRGLLSSKPGTSAPHPLHAVEVVSAVDEEPDAVAVHGRRPSARRQTTEKRSAASEGGLARVGVRVRPELYAGLVARATATGQSHGNIVLDAIEDAHTHQVLEQLLAPKSDHDGGLFPRTQPRGLAEARVPMEIRLRAKAVQQVDDLVRTYGAVSRTALIIAALEYHLPRAADDAVTRR